MRAFLMVERDRLAEARFMADVAAGRIQFRLRTDRNNWKMPHELDTDLPVNATQLHRNDGMGSEWWHRNVARAGQYHLQGWKKNKAGELEIVDGGTSFECDLVLMSEWKTKLPSRFTV